MSADSHPRRVILSVLIAHPNGRRLGRITRVHEESAMKINYPAVVASALAYWMLGALLYGVLFGPRWMALEHLTVEQGKSMNSALPYIITLLLHVLMAYVLAQFCAWRKVNSA